MIVKKMLVDFLNDFIVNCCDCTSDVNLDGELDYVYSFLESEVDVEDFVDKYIKRVNLNDRIYKIRSDIIRDFILFYRNENRNEYEDEIVELSEIEKDWIRLYGELNE